MLSRGLFRSRSNYRGLQTLFHITSTSNEDRKRSLHTTRHNEITPLLIGLGLAASALTASYLIKAAETYQAQRASGKPVVSAFKNHYTGGFEDVMTRREAALILGVRETATKERIQEAHRRLLMANHPDTGGSTYISSKINEAKELIMKQ